MKNPHHWEKQNLFDHLQHAVDLELWTIPLYMTSLYSIKGIEGVSPKNYPKTAKLLQSVLNEEMLHLEIACNLCNALGYSPKINSPIYSKDDGIPFLSPQNVPLDLSDYSVQLGPLNVSQLKLFCAIESPQKVEDEFWANKAEYESIAELYAAISIGVQKYWEECYDPKNQKQKANFQGYKTKNHSHLGVSQIIDSLESALNGIEVIIEQGEGAQGKYIPEQYQPPVLQKDQPYHPGWYEGDICHFQKFHLLLNNPESLPATYKETKTADGNIFHNDLMNNYTQFLEELQKSFNSNGDQMTSDFWTIMMGLSSKIQQVWAQGICPDWKIDTD